MFHPHANWRNVVVLGAALALACQLSSLAAGQASTTNSGSPAIQFTSFLVDGQTRLLEAVQSLSSGNPIRISQGHQKLQFIFGPTTAYKKRPVRLRYRLEGYETGWHDIGDPMRFVIHFRDSQDVPVGSADFPVHGDSPGWTGKVATSPFIERHEQVTVPDRCHNARIWIPSGGNPDTVGIYVIDDLKVTRLANANQPAEVLLADDFETGRELDNPLGDLDGWIRDGTSLSIAQIVKTGRGPQDHALALIDDAPDRFGAWDADDKKLLHVNPGDRLLFEWKEMYSIGGCRSETVTYENLPVGDYRLVVCTASVYGLAQGGESAMTFQVVLPFYRQGWFQGACLLFVGGLLAGSVRYAVWRRLQRKIQHLDFQNLMEKERSRIAQDIHDDLGTRLTRISLISEAVRRDAQNSPQLTPGLDEIRSTVMEMTRALDEIVWAVDPQQDSLESLVSYLVCFAQDLLGMAGVKCRLSFPVKLPPWVLFPDVRHNLFLAFNEVLNNAIKHAQATEVHIGLNLEASQFVLWITDNGRGFDQAELAAQATAVPPTRFRGSGLSYLKTRLEKIRGKLEIHSQPGQGTKVVFVVPVPPSTTPN
jgi:signal transduction histidine kinase